jgi:hypothetical protein
VIPEAEVQHRLEALIRSGTLFTHIAEADALVRADAAHASRLFIPQFSLDYLVRRLAIRSAADVLASLKQVDIVSTARSNISIDRAERLFPDLVLVSRVTGHVLVVEVKRDDQTTREALTELLAYEQEIRNQLPYLSDGQIMFILVSRSFPTLLSHAIGQTILWQEKQVLALEVTESEASLKLRVVLPLGWTSTRLTHVPAECFETIDLVVRPPDQETANALDGLMLDLTHVIAREGERLGSHGFVLVSAEEVLGASAHRDVLTVGVVSASAMAREMTSRADQPANPTQLMNYLKEAEAARRPPYDLLGAVIRPAIELLGERCEVVHRDNLAARLLDTSERSVFYRYDPYAMLFWGLPQRYRDVLTRHEGFVELFPFAGRRLHPQDATIGLFVLDYLTDNLEFRDGEFRYESLWRFGTLLGRCRTILQRCAETANGRRHDFSAAITWLGHQLAAATCEIAFRVNGAINMAAPPALRWGGAVGDVLNTLDEWISWFRETFLGNHEMHRQLFDEGMALHLLFDETLGASLTPERRGEMMARVSEAVRRAYLFAVGALADPVVEERQKHRMETILQEGGFSSPREGEAADRLQSIDLLKALPSMFRVYDVILPSVVHELAPIDTAGVDWDWMRQEVAAAGGGDRRIAVLIRPGGQIEIADLSEMRGPLPMMSNYGDEVLLAIEHSGDILSVHRSTWQQLIDGSAFKRLFPDQAPGGS